MRLFMFLPTCSNKTKSIMNTDSTIFFNINIEEINRFVDDALTNSVIFSISKGLLMINKNMSKTELTWDFSGVYAITNFILNLGLYIDFYPLFFN